MNTTKTQTIGEMVAEDYRLAEIFSKHKIDFCCKGNRSIVEACESKDIDSTELLKEIESLNKSGAEPTGQIDFRSWPLDLLADYIEKKHHRYVESKTPVIMEYLIKIAGVHRDAHPELPVVRDLFIASGKDLAAHMKKEELILFPHIRKMMKAALGGKPVVAPHFGTVQNPIAMMMEEHEAEGDRFARISELTDNYTTPADACSTYKVAFAMLADFEKDLHSHIHLENNILFPQAAEMEQRSTIEKAV